VDTFSGKLAVVTGGGSGIGRALVDRLAAEGCSVAACDLRPDAALEAATEAERGAAGGVRVTGHGCDVSQEEHVLRFRDEVLEQHGRDHVDLVFNNAGIAGGSSFVTDPREVWERTFAVDFWGVYYGTRAFLPLLIKSEEGVLVNTSSVNGFWASLGPGMPNSAYCTAKFAVRGLTESLIEDLRIHAPHVKVAVVMPGHIGTGIVENSHLAHRLLSDADPSESLRESFRAMGVEPEAMDEEELRRTVHQFSEGFASGAPTTAEEAAVIILEGLRQEKWRILVGEDAKRLDRAVHARPEGAYDYEDVGLDLPGREATSA
jgi:NAD(P)-dependent dehydrogenase (short-subunit alcohol dehydrogenase family)